MFIRQMKYVGGGLLLLALVFFLMFLFITDREVDEPEEVVSIEDIRCFGTRDFVRLSEVDPGGYAYRFARFVFNEDDSVSGSLDYIPYKTDSAQGVFTGSYDKDTSSVYGVYEFFTEGSFNKEERQMRFNSDGLVFGFGSVSLDENEIYRYDDRDNLQYDYQLPLISCKRYEAWYQEFKLL